MDPELNRLQSTTQKPAFKNNNEITGSFIISGTAGSVANIQTHEIELPFAPALAEVLFQGPSDEAWEGTLGDQDPRPTAAWFKRGQVWSRGDDAVAGYSNEAMPWQLSAKIADNILTIQADYFKQFVADLAITPITVYYKVIDYSVF